MSAINPTNRAPRDWGLEVLDPSTLKLRKSDTRKHPRPQIEAIKTSLDTLDQLHLVLIDKDNHIIDGAAVVIAAIEMGISVTALRIKHLSPDQLREARLVLNKLGERGQWSLPELKLEFQELYSKDLPALKASFETPETDLLLTEDSARRADEPPVARVKDPVTQQGSLWVVGRHAIICGDSRDPLVIDRLVQDRPIGAAILDPPYNKRVAEISGKGRHKHAEFRMASGEQTDREFANFNLDYLAQIYRVLAPGRLAYVFMDWRNIHILVAAGKHIGFDLKNICVWVKSNGGMGSLYRSQHEFVAVFQKPGAPGVNNVMLGKFGRSRTNVWHEAGANAFSATRDEDLATHPTVKPVELLRQAILDCTRRDEFVLDIFGGSGSTMLAAEKAGRRALLCEIDGGYVDATLARFAKQFGTAAVNASDGVSFGEASTQSRNAAQSPRRLRKPIEQEATDAT